MERHLPVILAVALMVLIMPAAHGQVNTPCTPSMLSSFTPCMNFVTNSSGNGRTSPTADCCGSLKSLTNNGMDCLCLIVTGSVPFQIPINRSLAVSLPRACNMPGVPVQCKASSAPIPAPGPIALGPILSPTSSPKAAPSVPQSTPPESDTTQILTPPSPTDSEAPATTTGSRPVLTPSSANLTHCLSPSLLLFALGFVVLKHY